MALADLNRSPRCQHVHYSGKPCKAPARRGRNYCVFHQAAHFDAGGCVLPIIEDSHSYQLAVIRIARALADDIITPHKATALLYALQLAGYNMKQFVSDRRDIEDPDGALGRTVLAHFITKRMHIKPPTDEECAEILQEIHIERPREPRHDLSGSQAGGTDATPHTGIAEAPSPVERGTTSASAHEPGAMGPAPGPLEPSSDFGPPHDGIATDSGIDPAGMA